MRFYIAQTFNAQTSRAFHKKDSLWFVSGESLAAQWPPPGDSKSACLPSIVAAIARSTLCWKTLAQVAVSRFNVWRIAQGLNPCSAETTSYSEARQQLPEQLPLDLASSIGQDCVAEAKSEPH